MSLLTSLERHGNDAAVTHTLQVTPDNFVRAESDMQFMTVVKRGGFGRLVHEREFASSLVAWCAASVAVVAAADDLAPGIPSSPTVLLAVHLVAAGALPLGVACRPGKQESSPSPHAYLH